jgi:hypothetical protein
MQFYMCNIYIDYLTKYLVNQLGYAEPIKLKQRSIITYLTDHTSDLWQEKPDS